MRSVGSSEHGPTGRKTNFRTGIRNDVILCVILKLAWGVFGECLRPSESGVPIERVVANLESSHECHRFRFPKGRFG